MLIRYFTRSSRRTPDPAPDLWTPGRIATVVAGTLVFLAALSTPGPSVTSLSVTPPAPSWARIPAPSQTSAQTAAQTSAQTPACPPGPADLIDAMGALEGQPPVTTRSHHTCR